MDRQKGRREKSDPESGKDEEKEREDGAFERVDAGQHSGRGGSHINQGGIQQSGSFNRVKRMLERLSKNG